MTADQRQTALDGLRGLAILLVVAVHTRYRPLNGGWVGVSLFFVVSGYIITTLLMARQEGNGGLGESLARFYGRRAARLLPALFLCLAGMLTVASVTGEVRAVVTSALLAAFYAGNFGAAFAPSVMTHAVWSWSLALEEQFYLVWPVGLVLLGRFGVARAKIARLLISAALALAVFRYWVASANPIATYDLIRGDELMLGCALALGRPKYRRWLTAPAVLVLAALTATTTTGGLMAVRLGIPLAGLAGVQLVAASVSDARVACLLTWRPLRHLGRISYSLYLWDSMLAMFRPDSTAWSLTWWLIASVAAAELSTFLIEEPIRRWVRGGNWSVRRVLSATSGSERVTASA